MPNDSTLSIIVKLQDDASAGLASIAANVSAVSEKIGSTVASISSKFSSIGSSMVGFGNSMKSVGTQMTTGVTLPIVGLGYEVATMANKFQQSMELIRTQAGASQSEVDSMTKSVLALAQSGETGQGPQKLAEGLYHLESLGLRGSQAMDALTTSAQAADTGIADMEGVTSALGAALVTGISGTQNMSQAMGTLDATIGAGNMRMEDLVAALGTGVLPAAKNFGLTLTDVGAALATLTDNGMRADESATRLRMTFSLMAAPTTKAVEALGKVGLGAYQLADDMRKPNGLVTALSDLKTHLENSGKTATQQAAILSAAFGGGRSSAAILTLVQQLDRVKTKYEQITQQAGEFADKVAATHETNQFKLNAALSEMQASMIDIGGTVGPMFAQMLQTIAKYVADLAHGWDNLSPGMQQFIVKALAMVAVVGPALVIFGTLTTTIGRLFQTIGGGIKFFMEIGKYAKLGWTALVEGGPVVWIIVGAIVALGIAAYELWKHWDAVKAGLSAAWKEIKGAWDTVVGALADGILAVEGIWNSLVTTTKAIWNDIMDSIKWTIDLIVGAVVIGLNALFPGWQKGLQQLYTWWVGFWTNVGSFFTGIWNLISTTVQNVIAGIANFIAPILDAITTAWKTTWQGIKDFFVTIGNDLKSAVDGVLSWINNKIQAVIDAWNRMTAIVGKPVQTAWGAATGAVSSVGSAIMGAVNSAAKVGSSITHFEAGGFVNAPRGTAVPIMAHGGEQIIPAEQVGRHGANGVTVNIINPSVRSNADLAEIRKQIEQVMRPLMTNSKVIYA